MPSRAGRRRRLANLPVDHILSGERFSGNLEHLPIHVQNVIGHVNRDLEELVDGDLPGFLSRFPIPQDNP